MTISRRYFLKSGGIAMLGLASLPSFLQRAVAATASPNKKKMVVLFQRGAMDGLNVVVPFAEPNYYNLRPTIAIPSPRKGERPLLLTWMVFSACIPVSNQCTPFFKMVSSRSFRLWVLRTRPDRTSTRRILWNPERLG